MKKRLLFQIIVLLCFASNGFAAKYVFVSSKFLSISEISEEGYLSGLGVDIIRTIATDLKIDVKIKILPFKRMMAQMKSKSADAAFGVYKKPDREKFMDYIDLSFFNDSYLFYTHHSTKMKWNGEMTTFPKNRSFCWIRGWSYFDELYKLKDQIKFQPNNSLKGCLGMLALERVDLVAGPIRDIIPTIREAGYENKIRLITKDKGLVGNYIAFPKGHLPSLQEKVKQSLVRILNSKWYKIQLRRYGLDVAVE